MPHKTLKTLLPTIFTFLLCCNIMPTFAQDEEDIECKYGIETESGKKENSDEPKPCRQEDQCYAFFCSSVNLRYNEWACYENGTDGSCESYAQNRTNEKRSTFGLPFSEHWLCRCFFGSRGMPNGNAIFVPPPVLECKSDVTTEKTIANQPGDKMICSSEETCAGIFCTAGQLQFNQWTCTHRTAEQCSIDGPELANKKRAELGLATSEKWKCVCQYGKRGYNMSNANLLPPSMATAATPSDEGNASNKIHLVEMLLVMEFIGLLLLFHDVGKQNNPF